MPIPVTSILRRDIVGMAAIAEKSDIVDYVKDLYYANDRLGWLLTNSRKLAVIVLECTLYAKILTDKIFIKKSEV